MISIHQAKQIILDAAFVFPPVSIPIEESLDKIIFSEIFSPIDLPPFPQSSMDGYAFAFDNLKKHSSLEVRHKIAAGDESIYAIKEGEAVRIFTGAPIPPGADTVVMQEKTEIKEGRLFIYDENLREGSNYRNKASEIKKGDLALSMGSRISPAAIGFLASMGISDIEVYRSPSVCILVTGDELAGIGTDLKHGQIYDSNSYTLIAAFKEAGITAIEIKQVPDQIDVIKKTMKDALDCFDILVLTGGVSVGDFDFVSKAAEEIGVQPIFHKIKQKPGKPMYFGIAESKAKKHFVFGLPGNPASALTCFYEYLEPALKKMMGSVSSIKIIQAPITASYHKPAGLTHFLKGSYEEDQVTPLEAQESFRLKSFARANALIVIDEEITEVLAGQLVEVHILP